MHLAHRSLIALSALLVLACGQRRPGRVQALRPVTVAFTRQPQGTLLHVALAKGYFREEGLEIQPLLRDFGKEALGDLLEGRADFATVAETPVMFGVLKGEPVAVVAQIEASNLNNAIIARRDAGIRDAAALKGKRIAFTPGTTSEFFLDSMLTVLGLTRGEIRPVPLNPEEMLGALREGRADAACTWNYPLARIKRALGPNGLAFFDREIYTEFFTVSARPEYLRKNEDTSRRFLKALVKAERFVAEDPDEARRIMAAATGVDLETVREVWDAFHYRAVLEPALVIALEDETRWAIRNGMSDRREVPDFTAHVHAESLRAVAPSAVRLNW
jgi:NitT/TauT family transport system substrate-binding protein